MSPAVPPRLQNEWTQPLPSGPSHFLFLPRGSPGTTLAQPQLFSTGWQGDPGRHAESHAGLTWGGAGQGHPFPFFENMHKQRPLAEYQVECSSHLVHGDRHFGSTTDNVK